MSAQPDTAAAMADAKEIATLRARLALAGHFELIELPAGGFVVKRWNWTQHCANTTEVEQFVERVEQMR